MKSRVYVIDDDALVRHLISRLLQASGYSCRVFDSAVSYLDAELDSCEAACLVCDVKMPVITGVDLQGQLAGTDHDFPIVFVSAHGDIPTCVQALKAGAVNFLQKPFEEAALLTAVREALHQSNERAVHESMRQSVLKRYRDLSPREQEVLAKVVAGKLNKQSAAELGIAEKTVKIHRSRMMDKMGAQCVADLVRMAEYCDVRNEK